MSIAWATIALVVLLLPGVLFFIGQYLPEQFTRDTTPRSALGQLAGVVLISLLVHGLYFTIQPVLCHWLWSLPCIDLTYVLGLLNAGRPGEIELSTLASDIERYRVEIFTYLLASALAGFTIGAGLGNAIRRGHFRFLAQHRWVLDLPLPQAASHTYAHVLTRISHEGRQLVYRGRVEQFGLLANGQFSYVVLSGTHRAYMRLLEGASVMDSKPHPIGTGANVSPSGQGRRLKSLFVVEGPDIANVIFDSYAVDIRAEPEALEELSEIEKASERRQEKVLEQYVTTGTVVTPPFATCVKPFALPNSIIGEPGRSVLARPANPSQMLPQVGKQVLPGELYYVWRIATGRNLRSNIVECSEEQIFLGVPYPLELGGKTGQVRQGTRKLIAADPAAHWSDQTNAVEGSSYSDWRQSPRVIQVGLFDPPETARISAGGERSMAFTHIAQVFIEDPGPQNLDNLQVRFVGITLPAATPEAVDSRGP
jgi:hypothetical protein